MPGNRGKENEHFDPFTPRIIIQLYKGRMGMGHFAPPETDLFTRYLKRTYTYTYRFFRRLGSELVLVIQAFSMMDFAQIGKTGLA